MNDLLSPGPLLLGGGEGMGEEASLLIHSKSGPSRASTHTAVKAARVSAKVFAPQRSMRSVLFHPRQASVIDTPYRNFETGFGKS